MLLLPQRANKERVWRIFEVFAEQKRELKQRELFVYEPKAKQAL